MGELFRSDECKSNTLAPPNFFVVIACDRAQSLSCKISRSAGVGCPKGVGPNRTLYKQTV